MEINSLPIESIGDIVEEAVNDGKSVAYASRRALQDDTIEKLKAGRVAKFAIAPPGGKAIQERTFSLRKSGEVIKKIQDACR